MNLIKFLIKNRWIQHNSRFDTFWSIRRFFFLFWWKFRNFIGLHCFLLIWYELISFRHRHVIFIVFSSKRHFIFHFFYFLFLLFFVLVRTWFLWLCRFDLICNLKTGFHLHSGFTFRLKNSNTSFHQKKSMRRVRHKISLSVQFRI